MGKKDKKPPWEAKVFLGAIGFAAFYLVLALTCLWQWGKANPWSRIDIFSGSALLLSWLLAIQQLSFVQKLPRSQEIVKEAYGTTYDAEMGKLNGLLALGELTVFLDYGHWHLAPALEERVLQGLGLFLYVTALLWLMWVDSYLARHFSSEQSASNIITDGPYRFMRHPRYAGLIVTRIAFALTFASVIGWLFTIGWALVVLRRIRLEEPHLRKIFGAKYDIYANNTARLIPGIY